MSNEFDTHILNESLKKFKSGTVAKAIVHGTNYVTKVKPRLFQLDANETHIDVKHTNGKKKKETIFMKDVRQILTGEPAVNGNLKKFFISNVRLKPFGLTVEYGSNAKLDIVCDDEKQFQSWIITLNFLKREANMRYEEDPIRLYVLNEN